MLNSKLETEYIESEGQAGLRAGGSTKYYLFCIFQIISGNGKWPLIKEYILLWVDLEKVIYNIQDVLNLNEP